MIFTDSFFQLNHGTPKPLTLTAFLSMQSWRPNDDLMSSTSTYLVVNTSSILSDHTGWQPTSKPIVSTPASSLSYCSQLWCTFRTLRFSVTGNHRHRYNSSTKMNLNMESSEPSWLPSTRRLARQVSKIVGNIFAQCHCHTSTSTTLQPLVFD